MVRSPNNWQIFNERLQTMGLLAFGGFAILPEECSGRHQDLSDGQAVLIGNAGSDMWEVFSKSSEYADDVANPMDGWTERVLTRLAADFDAQVIFPFEKPHWPFQQFAKRAGHANISPLGLVIHQEYGLWHAFRGAFVWPSAHEFSNHIKQMSKNPQTLNHPCETCAEKPCLSSCPVDAFDGQTLNRETCFSHLDSDQHPKCMSVGCRARDACPVGPEYRYQNAQIRFHMASYRGL